MSVEDDVEAFARVQAALRRPFARREDVLRGAGLTESSLEGAQRAWAARLAADDAAALRARFRVAFAAKDEPLAAAVATPAEPPVAPSEPSTPPTAPIRRAVPSYLHAAQDPVDVRLARLALADADSTQPPVARAEPTLPFIPGVAGEVPEAVREQRGAAQREPRPPAADGDETAFLPSALFREPPSRSDAPHNATPVERAPVESDETIGLGADPVGVAASALEPWMSLEEYVRFLAALASNPADGGALRARYGIASEEAQRALGASFAHLFARHPAERSRFDALLARARGAK